MSLRAMVVSGLAVAGLLLTVPAAQAATPAQLTGTQLNSRLLPASYFPSGYKIVKSTVFNSGRHLEHGPARFHLGTFSCKKYLIDGLSTGFGETAVAGYAVNRHAQAFLQTVWQFATASQAASFYRQFYAFMGRCRTITATVGQDKATLTTQLLKKTHVGSHPAFRAVQKATFTGLPVTFNDTRVTRVGTDVYLIDALGFKVPTKPTVPAALLRLIARVRA